MSNISIRPALGAGGALYAYQYSISSFGAPDMMPAMFAAGGSLLYDMFATQIMMYTKMDTQKSRALYVFGVSVAASYYLFPAAPMQTRLIDGAIAAAGAYALSM